jgi:hypothetical protein
MTYFRRETLSDFIRTGCLRQLRLNLARRFENAKTLDDPSMPPPQPPRPGVTAIRELGEEYEAEKCAELAAGFGTAAIIGSTMDPTRKPPTYGSIPLASALDVARAGQFIVQGEYAIGQPSQSGHGSASLSEGAFERALGIGGLRAAPYALTYARLRPDLIAILAPRTHSHITPRGDVVNAPTNDERLQLRVIDIKLSAEPGPAHFAQVAYYMMTLAGWLEDNGFTNRFCVADAGALWPGSHEMSAVRREMVRAASEGRQPRPSDLGAALSEDLEPLRFDVFAPRVRDLMSVVVPQVLDTPEWRALPWHVDGRCAKCDFLGAPWVDAQGKPTWVDDHCCPLAASTGHLSTVFGLSRGAGGVLNRAGVGTTTDLAGVHSADDRLGLHHSVRSQRTVLPARAHVLNAGPAGVVHLAGTSAIMPRWADVRIYVTIDFDQTSGLTFAMGLSAVWLRRGLPAHTWQRRTFVVTERSQLSEEREFRSFLGFLANIIQEVQGQAPTATFQVYLWSTLERAQLTTMMGRHLNAVATNGSLRALVWLFPSDDVVPEASQSGVGGPITIVGDIARAVLAAPVSHVYTLLDVARCYNAGISKDPEQDYSLDQWFDQPLTDQLPNERAHEVWSRSPSKPYWQDVMQGLERAVKTKLLALWDVTARIERDLRPQLYDDRAPAVQRLGPSRSRGGMSRDGELWYAYYRLDVEIDRLDIQELWARPAHEREARFDSAYLIQQLTGVDEANALSTLGLRPSPTRRVYSMSDDSKQFRARDADFAFALAPRARPDFMELSIFQALGQTIPGLVGYMPVRIATSVTIDRFDREHALLALSGSYLDDVERAGCDLSHDVMLDPVPLDFFTKRLEKTLKAIGNPPAARRAPLRGHVIAAQGNPRPTAPNPVEPFLWGASRLSDALVSRSLTGVEAQLQSAGVTLDASQSSAWAHALGRRLSLLWGPPGTGKSSTVEAIILGALLAARLADGPIRVLLCTDTYTALDTVLLPLEQRVRTHWPGLASLYRLRSTKQNAPIGPLAAIDTPSSGVDIVDGVLRAKRDSALVGATPQQAHKLLCANGGTACEPRFDLIVIDEAGQMSVGHALLALAGVADDGTVVCAGDPLQLPPILHAEAPSGVEAMVGSIYQFYERVHSVAPQRLLVNYRSNHTIVSLAHRAGYDPALASKHPDLRLDLAAAVPATRPADWPDTLPYDGMYGSIVDPTHATVSIVHDDVESGQASAIEAQTVAAIAYLLRGRVCRSLANDPTGAANGRSPVTGVEYWEHHVGIVTPHRAQQGEVIRLLQQCCPRDEHAAIRGAIDTVERFQGGQRNTILVSYGVGDPDVIALEEEFLLSLNRFNVAASRARAKLVVMLAQSLVRHLAADPEVLDGSRLLKSFVDSFCQQARQTPLPYLDQQGVARLLPAVIRWST